MAHRNSNPYSLARKRRRRRGRERYTKVFTRRAFLLFCGVLLGRAVAKHSGPWPFSSYRLVANLTQGWLPERWRSPLLARLNPPPQQPELMGAELNPVANQTPVTPTASDSALSPVDTPVQNSPVQVARISIKGVPLYRTIIDLSDPETFITLGLAKNAPQANSHKQSVGDEEFSGFVKRYPAAVIANATFFSKDHQKRVMGNMVAEGRFLKYSRWENYGTTLGLREGKRLEMVTARTDGKPRWHEHWFSLTGGPRLLREGKFWIAPKSEGFRDPSVLGIGSRTAIGFPKNGDRLILATFLVSMTLEQEAHAMKNLGCYEAMNLDGGTSGALAHRGKVLLDASRPLTNVLVVYDRKNPAPPTVKDSWLRFQAGERPKPNA